MSKSIFFSFVLLLLVHFFAHAQQSNFKIDSLKLTLKKAGGVQKFVALNLLSEEYSNSDLNLSMNYAKMSLTQALLLKKKEYVASSYNSIANVFQYKSELDSALFYQKKALHIRQQTKDLLGIADSYNNLGIIFDTKGQFAIALDNYFKALYYFEIKNDIEKQAMTNTNIGIVYKAQNEYKKAFLYYEKAFNLYLKTTNTFGQTVSAGNLGSILINLKQYNQSLKYSLRAKKGYEKLGYDRFLAYPLSNIACVFDSLHQFRAAELNYLKSIQLFKKFSNKYQVAEISNLYSKCLYKQKKYNESFDAATTASVFAKESNASILRIQSYKILYDAAIKLGNYKKAATYINQYCIGKDSLFTAEKTKTIFELEAKYQTEKKEKQLLKAKNKLFQKEVALQKEKLAVQEKNNMILVISVTSVFLFILGYAIYRKKQLEQKALLATEQIKQREILTQAVIEAEETERKRIASDLHDGVGQLFSAVKMNLGGLLNRMEITKDEDRFLAEKTMALVDESCKEVRVISHKMMPNFLLKSGIAADIKNFIEKIDEHSLKISFESQGFMDQLEFNEETVLYRVIQELINNVIKHANANELQISLNKTKQNIQVKIVDNGIGFDYGKAIEKGGLGLKNILVRIKYLKGTVQFSSNLPTGTAVQIDIPLS